MRPYLNRYLPLLIVIGTVGLFLLPGCGGGGSSSPASSPSPSPSPVLQVSIQPPTITLAPQAREPFVGTVANTLNQALFWSVVEGTPGGTVNADGLYTAPALAGVYHIVAKSAVDTSQSATATVTVPVVVTVSPATATTISQPVTFTSSINDAQNGSVTWTVQEGEAGGTITPGGVYTPPGLGGVFHVIATSAVDGSTQGIAIVTVSSGGATGVIQ